MTATVVYIATSADVRLVLAEGRMVQKERILFGVRQTHQRDP
jgi:hypothetical protein